MVSRRAFVATGFAGVWAVSGLPRRGPGPHPEPRPGIDGSRVLTADQLHNPDVAGLFDGIRRIPHVADGIRCTCGCNGLEGFRSLLSCFEGDGMAQHCERCQTEGAMVVRLAAAGRTLDEIRAAVDARFP